MQYIKVTFAITSQDMSDMLIAMLSGVGYNGFEENEHSLLAYIEAPLFIETEVADIASVIGAAYEKEIVPSQNWNALWESNFEPVIVEGICTVRAHFHNITVATPHEIVITPKMSFGTGHHATTQLMMIMMNELDFNGRSVLDFGTGTGVLAIFAEQLGASSVIAIDNDEWSVENAIENTERNNCTHIVVKAGSLEDAGADVVDIILANINRHILLEYMQQLYQKLNDKGITLMSGLLVADRDIIVNAATMAGFEFVSIKEQGGWIAILFKK